MKNSCTRFRLSLITVLFLATSCGAPGDQKNDGGGKKGPIPVAVGADTKFKPADMNYIKGFKQDPPALPDGTKIGQASRKINGNLLEVTANLEADTQGAEWKAYAWQQLGVEIKVIGAAGAVRLAEITYKLSYSAEASATGQMGTTAEGTYSVAYGLYEKPAAAFEIVSTNQPGRLPLTAEVPPPPSKFSSDSQNNLLVTTSANRLEAGKVYVLIVQAKAWAGVKGQGSAAVHAGSKANKLTLQEINLVWK